MWIFESYKKNSIDLDSDMRNLVLLEINSYAYMITKDILNIQLLF